MIRLNKYLSECGISSRRNADQLIAEGRVSVNGKIVWEMGTTINPQKDSVFVDERKIEPAKPIYLMFNKPKGCITSLQDEKGRKTIYDYLQDVSERVLPVGRLDYDSEGLLLLTNDGALIYQLTHPSHEIPKTYQVKVEGEVPESELATLRKGVEIDGKKTARAKIKLLEFKNGLSKFEVTIFEGRNRQIRKMFAVYGRNVVFLKRIAIGELRLGGLSRGGRRYLNDSEVNYLKSL